MTATPAGPRRQSQRLQRSNGAAELSFRKRAEGTALAHLFQSDPCRVMFPDPESGDALQAVLVTTSGGLTDGDRVGIAVACEPGAEIVVSGQAAEKIYRAASEQHCEIDIALSVGAGAVLEWLPQETILFEGARLRRRTEADLAPDARLLACEILAFGRTAGGEQFTQGAVLDRWRLRRDGRLIWADALQVSGGLPQIAGFGDATACGLAFYAGDGSDRLLALSRTLLEDAEAHWPELRGGTTLVNGVLLARFLGASKDVRQATMGWLARLRAAALGRPQRLPRVWHV